MYRFTPAWGESLSTLFTLSWGQLWGMLFDSYCDILSSFYYLFPATQDFQHHWVGITAFTPYQGEFSIPHTRCDPVNFFHLLYHFYQHIQWCFGKCCVIRVQFPPPKSDSKLMRWIFFLKTPPSSEKQVPKLENHASLPNGKPYIYKEYDWKNEVFISPVQF